MKDPFSPTANFSGMSNGPLQIDEVFHKAFVHVDEQGTEAAAATATTMSKGLVRSVSVNVDRPFIFLIRHDPTGTVLFIGRVINPE
jgi:serpin B